jgi:TM2 domain-containing membrane protein YozV
LGVFLGFCGAHNFYLGRTLSGTLQLLLGLGGLCFGGWMVSWPWAMVEVILIAAGVIDKDAKGMPLT